MAEKTELFKRIGKQAGVIGGSYLLSRFVSDKFGRSMMKKPAPADPKTVETFTEDEDKELKTKRALVGAGLAVGSYFLYSKIDDKVVASGLMVGSGLNAAIKVLSIPSIKKSMPDAFKAYLDGDDYGQIPATTQGESYEKEIKRRVDEGVRKNMEAARIAGYLPDPNSQQNYNNLPTAFAGSISGQGNPDPTFAGNDDPTFAGEEDRGDYETNGLL